jgi:hypothetical protein
MMCFLSWITGLAVMIGALSGQCAYAGLNQFDVTNNALDLDQFMSGGPAKDGIPSLDQPKFITAQDADFLRNNDLVIGVMIDGIAKAYPLESIVQMDDPLDDQIGNMDIVIRPLKGGGVEVIDKHSNLLPSIVAYWFAWSGFNQETLVYMN